MIDSIIQGGNCSINGGQCEDITLGYGMDDSIIINDATVGAIALDKGGTAQINSGKIGLITLANMSGDINVTIGDVNREVNNNNPEIDNIYAFNDCAGTYITINFYNGIIHKRTVWDPDEGQVGFDGWNFEEACPAIAEYNIREGYKEELTSDGIILVPNT